MATEIKAPAFPESVADGTIATWHKQPGEYAERDELLVDIETDKVVLEVVAPDNGSVKEIVKAEGEVVQGQELIGWFEAGERAGTGATGTTDGDRERQPAAAATEQRASPAARKLLDENDLSADRIEGSGRGGLVTKEDVLNYLDREGQEESAAPASQPPPDQARTESAPVRAPEPEPVGLSGERVEKRVTMTRMRARIAERLLDARRDTAMLTTFNEIDMQPIVELRKRYRDLFERKHGIRLGFMGFFVKAATEALKRFPIVNASIDGTDIVYHGYQDIGIAVSTDRGLVVPILRDTDTMNVADIEARIIDYGKRAREGKLSLEDMQGGSFTITNGGVFGSLLSTPILNPPQAAILGMHKIQERPVAIDGEVVVRPMMYVALSYDHRLVDGKDSVQFLVAVKELLEDPARILLDI